MTAISAAARLATFGVLVLLAGCALAVDAEQARVCRTALPALNPPGVRLTVLRTAPWPQPRSIRIDYRVEQANGAPVAAFVICTFAAEGLSPSKAEIVALATEAGPVAESTLFLLKRFYLDSPEGAAAAPPAAVAGELAAVPLPLAYWLQQALVGLPRMAIYGLLAAAYALVYGLVGRINLAFGEIAAVGAAGTAIGVAAAVSGEVTAPLLGLAIGLVAAMFAAAVHSAAGGHLTITRIGGASGQPSLIATVGLSLALMEYLRLAQGPVTVWIPPVWSGGLALLRAGDFVVSVTPMALVTAAIGFAAGGGLVALLARTSYGRAWRAYADDPGAAALFGVDGPRLMLQTLALAGAMAGLAGTLVVAQFGGLGFAGGFQLGLKALIAAILGGIGSVPGALIGGLSMGAVETLWSAAMPIEARDIALYSVLIVVLVFRPGGLFGFAEPGGKQV